MERVKGKCYLVGAGPGDPGLLTIKGQKCLLSADVLVYDALSSIEFLRLVPKDCEKIYAGKRASDHAIPQGGINALIVEKAKEGKTVVRLKGGDPMIFGRGGEEAAELAEAGVPFEIVPGISSAIGGAAYAGIPVTHRDHCSQLTLFTGHEDPSKENTSLDYAKLAEAEGTRVFLMGVSRLREITSALIEHGADPDIPMALTRWATTGRQRTIEGTLGSMADIAEKEHFKSPAVAVLGDVVRERSKINWFETRPLFGQRIVVTRTREQAGELSSELFEAGADVVELPTIRIEPPAQREEFSRLVTDVHTYDWVIFTSPNGVERFFDAFFAAYEDARSFGKPKIAAIGPATAKKIAEYRFATDLLPEKFVAEGLVEALKKEHVESQTVLWVKAEDTREIIYDELMAQGAIVDRCIAYRNVPESGDPTGALESLTKDGADVITFTSGSTVERFFALGVPWPEGCKAASIGPVTSGKLREHGIEPEIEAAESNIQGLVTAILEHYQS